MTDNDSLNRAITVMPLAPLTMPLRGLQVIEASAGTGKTWTLAALYVRLVLGHDAAGLRLDEGLMPSQILVMTFTDAATAELRGRIRARLAQAAGWFRGGARAPQVDPFLRDLRDKIAQEKWPACAERLALAAQSMDEAAIFTIHGWSSRMLTQHAFDSASLFRQSRVEDSKGLKLAAVQDYWRTWFYPLAPDQLAALDTLGRTPAALLDKLTKVWSIAEKAPAQQRTAPETPEAVMRSWDAWSVRCHGLESCARAAWTADVIAAMSKAGLEKKLKGFNRTNFDLWIGQMATWAQGGTIKLACQERFATSHLLGKGWDDAVKHDAFAHIEALCEHRNAEPKIGPALQAHAAHAIGEAYQRTKLKLGQFDFSDLLQRLYHALQAPDARLATAIRQQYPVALVDEFQDTDPWQYGALSRIYGSPGTGLIMIGDPKQAIYSFRGADLATYLKARESAQALHTLSGNFRSTAAVVAAVNHVFSRAAAPFGQVAFDLVEARNDSVMPLQVSGAQQVAMTVWHQFEFKPLRKAVAIRKMACVFATEMVSLLNTGAATPGDMAVLVKDRGEARAMREALAERGVRSVYLSDRDSVFSTPEASELWRILRAVSNPRSKTRLKAALATRLWGLDWDEMEARFQDDAWDRVVDQFHEWQAIWQRRGFLPMLHQLIHGQAIPARLALRRSAHDCERQLTNLLHLGDLLQAASLNLQGEAALVRYLEQQLQEPSAAGDAAQVRLESDGALVQVITVHKSKGLQYPLVFVPFLSHYRVAKPDSGQDDAQRLEEEIRLCYVALTRAEKALWLGLSEVKNELGEKTKTMSAVSMLLGRKAKGDLRDCLQGWETCADIVVAPAPEAGAARYAPGAASWQPKQALTPTRILASNWWTASFSALMREKADQFKSVAGDEARDLRLADTQLDESQPAVVATPLSVAPLNSFPAGSAYGTLLHDLLEWQANRGWPAPSAQWTALVARKAQRFNLDADQLAMIEPWIAATISTPLPLAPPFSLNGLGSSQAWPEMSFALPVGQLQAAELDGLITQHILPGQERVALQANQLEGMLIGFMDLVFEHDARYYVLDYKSNRLPDYGAEALQQAVLAHRYDVQMSLYLLALHRLLKARLKDYDYDRHIGGALYLFMRGIDQAGAGLHWETPPRELILALDLAFARPPGEQHDEH